MDNNTLLNKSRRLHYLYKIIDKEWQEVVFTPNKAQQLIKQKKKELKEKYGRTRLIILKARQLWMTTYELIDWLDDCLFLENQTIVITAHKQDKQREMFGKVKYAYDQLPSVIEDPQRPWGKRTKPEPQYNNVNELYFPLNNSRIRVSLDSRSGTPTRLHITEIAFRDDAEGMMTGTLPSIPKNAPITIETTANGVGWYFYELWKKNEWSDSAFHTIFIPRYTDDEYTSQDYRPTPSEFNYLHTHKRVDNGALLSQGQINWYMEKYEELGRMVTQEYPSTPVEAFLASWDCVFNTTILRNLPVLQFTEDPVYKDLRIYKSTTDRCLIGVDTSEGGKSGDNAVISVRDKDLKLLAGYYAKIPPDALCEVIDHIRKRYKQGVVGIERNNTGLVTLTKAKDYERYNRIYQEKTVDELTQRATSKFWRHTNAKTRPILISEYEEAIRTGRITEVDERCKSEMYTFIYNEKHRPEAQVGCHDDFIIWDWISLQMRKEPRPSNRVRQEVVHISSITRKPLTPTSSIFWRKW